jgi:hypothetical protein
MSKRTPFTLVFIALITACGVDDPKETTSSTSQGIGDPYCWDEWGDPIFDDGYDDFFVEIDSCYYWEDPGGGGGGGETSCSWPTSYSSWDAGYGPDGASACQNARDNARDDSREQCLHSAYVCTPHPGTTTVISVGTPYVTDSGYGCHAEASTPCTYTWW